MAAATIIHGGAVLLQEGLKMDWGVKLQDGLIAEVGPNGSLTAQDGDEVIEVRDQVILPGFINGHNHMYNVFCRGISTDAVVTEFSSFLDDYWWPYIENRITPEFAEVTARWSSVEMIDSGVTTSFDILEAPNAIPGALEREGKVLKEAGLRAILTFEACQRMSPENAELGLKENADMVRAHQDDPFVKGAMSIHTLFTCDKEYVKKARAMAKELGCKFHMHLSESVFEPNWVKEHYDDKPVRVYDELGVLDSDVLASQVVQADQEEIDILARTGASVVTMPLSNCEVGGGIAPVPDLLDAGVKVGIGTDGYINNFFEVMRGAFLIHKAFRQDPQVMGARQVYRMATDMGADALGMPNAGRIAPGMLADVITVKMLDTPTPINEKNIYDQLILYRNPADVKNVFVGGRQLKKDGVITTLDVEKAREEMRAATAEFWKFK
ncbi:amidohydrolase family protein [Pseudoflavonifractor sp. MSJ-37]|uniref:amidohydrolase family protein n=1 Tax=Pseudoflavonifractor sp. MSJ-37 TaxID=2841531 RepID=UPI0020A1544C|nr:amidohydrolase family protein [Pseudoflavonifractor sp. MSJ-37]